jgi:N-acyl-D-amino-acid deacylase
MAFLEGPRCDLERQNMPLLRCFLAISTLFLLGALTGAAQGPLPAPGPTGPRSVPPLTVAVVKRDLPRLRQLLDAGEDPNQKDDQGFSPWMWAVHFEDNEALNLLLARVSRIPATDVSARGVSAHQKLTVAASLNNRVAARALLTKGVPVDAPDVNGATPLLVAASSGYTDLMQMFLAAGADTNSADAHGDTPLMAAVRIGSMPAVKLLLLNRVAPNVTDRDGRTALHWAARTGRVDIVRALLDVGGAVDGLDSTDRTPLAYAQEKEHAPVVDLLKKRGARETRTVSMRAAASPREAVERSLPLLLRGWQTWSERQSCGACHHRLMIDRVAALAKQHGFVAAAALAEEQMEFFTRRPAADEPRLRQQLASEEGVLRSALGIGGDGSSGDALNLNAVLELGVPRSSALEARALLLARKQLGDGSWRTGLPRIPILSSDFTITAVAARTMAAYGGSGDAAEISERVERARRWLIAKRPLTTDDKTSRMLGLRWTHADDKLIKHAAEVLKDEQHADGGWSQLPGTNSDAYATGMVLVALHWGIGVPVSDPVYKRGAEYLLKTQESDGSWFVTKRAAASNAYFESGFPHGKFQFISYAGSCWATMALIYAAAPSRAA